MNYIFGMGIFFILMALGSGLHILNLLKTYKKVQKITEGDVQMGEVIKKISRNHGPNFTAFAITSWILLITAFVHFYFFAPVDLPKGVTYFRFISLMPSFLEISGFGIFMLVLFGIIAALFIRKHWLYSFYPVSNRMKRYIALTVPMLLVSIIISIVLGIWYSSTLDSEIEFWIEILRPVALALLLVSEGILIWPVIAGFKEGAT